MYKNLLLKAKEAISASYPFSSCFVKINQSNMHYIEKGRGKTILFLHGMPSSSYLWRNIIPQLSSVGRCIAVDLIGHGKSDSPNIEFSVKDHLHYVTAFIETLKLKNVTIVGHSWGSTLGIAYAKAHEENVEALCYLEPMLGAWEKWEDFNPYSPQAQEVFKGFRSETGWSTIVENNIFLEQVFVNGSLRQLSAEEKEAYVSPFKSIERRKAAWKAPQELPIAGSPEEVVSLVNDNYQWLKQTTIPQLFFYTYPAAFFTKEKVKKFAQQAQAVTLHYLGKGVYNHMEDYPYEIGSTLASWLKNDYSLTAVKPAFSLYTTIHKAIRRAIAETCVLAGQTDFFDNQAAVLFTGKFNSLLTLLRSHSIHEDTFIHPLLEQKQLPEFSHLKNDHEELEKQLYKLEQSLNEVLETEDRTKTYELGNEFYLALNQFNSTYLQHLQMEETSIMNCLREHYAISDLLDVMERFKKSQAPEEAMQSLGLMLAAINPHEALFMLANIQKTAPQGVFLKICELAQNVISEDNWEKISAQFSAQPINHARNLQRFSTHSIVRKNSNE